MEEKDFSWALRQIKYGKKLRRKGWNGKGIFIKLQTPDVNSKMTSPYIYMDTSGLQTDNEYVIEGLVPWVASQTDMFADDWELV